jgi:hypothetical protein
MNSAGTDLDCAVRKGLMPYCNIDMADKNLPTLQNADHNSTHAKKLALPTEIAEVLWRVIPAVAVFERVNVIDQSTVAEERA